MLKISTGIPLLGAGALSSIGTSAASAEDSKFVIEQGDIQIPLTPLQHDDYTAEEFYSYGSPAGASANTPTDLEQGRRSRLFLYEGPNGVSLVVIHDEPDNGNRGSTTFHFDTLPAEGSWVVKDDPGESYSRSRASWRWVSCCTDGGVFRGGLEEGLTELTISPSFDYGIDTWEALSGDAAAPTVTQLDMDQPITIRRSSQQNPLPELTNRKLDLIDDIRGTVPPEYLFPGQVVDRRAEQFTRRVRSESSGYGPTQRRQYGEAMERLIGAEQITRRATADATNQVIPRTTAAVVKAVASVASSKITDLAGGGVVGRGKKFLANRISRRGKSIRDTLVVTDELNAQATSNFHWHATRAESDFGALYRKAVTEEEDAVQSVTDQVAEHGIEAVADDPDMANALWGDLPDGIAEEFMRIAERLKDGIEGVFFQYHYFGAKYRDYDPELPRVDVPDEVGFSVDVPAPFDLIPGVPDEVSKTLDVPNSVIQQAIDDFTDEVDDLMRLADLVEEGTTGVGVDPVIDEGTDLLESRAADEELTYQDEEARQAVVDISTKVISASTRVASSLLDIINLVSTVVFALQALVIGLAVLTVAAFMSRAILLRKVTRVESNYLVSVPGYLATLGKIDLALAGINFATIGAYLNTNGWAHYAGAGSILMTDIEGGAS